MVQPRECDMCVVVDFYCVQVFDVFPRTYSYGYAIVANTRIEMKWEMRHTWSNFLLITLCIYEFVRICFSLSPPLRHTYWRAHSLAHAARLFTLFVRILFLFLFLFFSYPYACVYFAISTYDVCAVLLSPLISIPQCLLANVEPLDTAASATNVIVTVIISICFVSAT